MKQRRIKGLTINHYEQCSSVQYTPSRTEEYAPVLAQAEAHQDLRFHATVNNAETLIILPWESVISVYATYETVDVAAPTDAICGGSDSSKLVVTFNEERLRVGLNSDEAPCNVAIWPIAFIDTMTLDGEDIKEAWISAYNENPQSAADVIGGTYDSELGGWLITVPCDAESVKVTIVYKVAGASGSYTIALSIGDGGVG